MLRGPGTKIKVLLQGIRTVYTFEGRPVLLLSIITIIALICLFYRTISSEISRNPGREGNRATFFLCCFIVTLQLSCVSLSGLISLGVFFFF